MLYLRINMWMIANMLRTENITADITSGTANDLYGVSFSETPGRVCISMEGSNVLCQSNGDRIILSNCSFLYAFERMQQIFDCYNEWNDLTVHLCREGNWQRIVDSVEPMFPKPLVLFDLNKKVIAMSSRFPKGTVDAEWDYLLKYGVSSNSAIKVGRSSPRFIEALHEDPGVYYTAPRPNDKHEYLTVCIKCDGEPWGYFSSVSTENKYSHGEVDTLMSLAITLGNYIPNKIEKTYDDVSRDVFKDFLTKQNAEDIDGMNRMLNTYGWNTSERYCVVCAYFSGKDKEEHLHRMYASSVNTFEVPCVIVGDTVLFILNSNNPVFNKTNDQIQSLSKYFSVSLIYSLCLDNIRSIYYCYDQVRFVIDRAALESGKNYHFYHYAIDYIICKSDSTAMLYACKQEILELFREGKKSTDIACTFELYLRNERSLLKTSLEQKLHKNTITYRIQKALEKTSLNLEDSYEREYAKISFAVLRVLGY